MLVPAVSKGPAEEAEEVVSRQTQLLLSRFQGSVEVDSIDGLDFFSFSSAEDLKEFARSMDQLLEEQYREPRSPDESVPSSVARSGAADEEWRESDWTEERQPVVVLPRKTTDITKIKGWRRKAFGADQTSDQAADHTTRWVMDQMNEQALRQKEEEKQEPPALMTRRATAAAAAAAAAAASGGPRSASDQAVPQSEAKALHDKIKEENVQSAEASMSKSVRCAFLSSTLDEFLQNQSELRVGQLAQLNPNILPLPEGQGVLALSNPILPCLPSEGTSRQVGPTRQMTARPSARYVRQRAAENGRTAAVARTEHWKTSAPPAARRRRQGSAATDKAADELEAPSQSPAKPAAAATVEASSPKPPAKRPKTEVEEDAPFFAMTSRRLRGGHVTPDSSSSKTVVASKEAPKEVPKKKEPSTPKEPSVKKVRAATPEASSKSASASATKKTSVANPVHTKEPLPYGSCEDSGDYPLVPETQFTGEQKRQLQALLASTQCSRPLTVALPTEPCFVCPHLDHNDALAAAQALSPAEDGSCQKTVSTSGKPGTPSPATAEQKTAQVHAASASKGAHMAKKGKPVINEEVAIKDSTVEAPKTPRKAMIKTLPSPVIPASPTESIQSTRSRRPIRLPARFQDSALYFSPNGDLFDVSSTPVSPRQRGRSNAPSSSKAPQPQQRPPPALVAPVQPDAVQSPSSSSSSCVSSSSSCSSGSSSRSSSCGSCCEAAASSQASSKKNDECTKTFPFNGGRTLKQLTRLKTDGFVSLHSLNDSQASSTPDGSVDINVDSLSDSDGELSVGEEPRPKGASNIMEIKACRERIRRQQMQNLLMELQNVVFRTPSTKPVSKVSVLSQANQYLRCLTVLSSCLHKEKCWLKRRQAALEHCLQASRQGKQVLPLPRAEPRPAPIPAYVLEVCDLSDCTVPPLRDASDELINGGSVPTSLSVLPAAKSKKNGSSTGGKHHHAKKKHSSKSALTGVEKTSKQKLKAPRTEKGQDTASRTAPTKVEAATCKESDLETATRNVNSATVAFKLNDGHIGALRTIPATTANTPKKYTLYPAKGTMLGDLSKVAAAAQQIIGPCVIKRVKLRSGQTVYAYGRPGGDNAPETEGMPATLDVHTSGGGSGEEYQPLASGALAALKDEEVSTLHLAAPSSLDEPDMPCSPDAKMQEVACGDESQDSSLRDQQASHEDNVDDDEGDLGDTSEWISGDGDTCIVMKLPVSSDEEGSSSDES